MHVFGLTGGIASGKSAVASRFRERGVPVVDADKLARDVVAKGSEGLSAIVDAFGSEVLAEEGELDRKKLAAIVFSDESKRKRLNALTHPLIAQAGARETQGHAERGEPLVCYEAALLVENGMASAFRPLVVVAAPESAQLERAVLRDRSTREEALARIRSQMPLAEKAAAADLIVQNDGSLAELAAKADLALEEVCRRTGVPFSRYKVVSSAQ